MLVSLAVPSDEVRWWREVPEGPAGAASWSEQEHLRGAARRMLLAGALAVRGSVGHHGARHRSQALASLAGVLVEPAAGGGLTAFVPAATARPAVIRLHTALGAVRDAVDYQRTTGGMEAFDAAVRAGVSRELTESLVTLVRGSEGVRVALAWAPAAGVPEGCAARPEPVDFSPGDLPALRAAGARYLGGEPSLPVRVTGVVERLRRSGPRGPGSYGCGCWPGRRSPTSAWSWTRRRIASPDTHTWSGCRSGSWGAWRAGAVSGGSSTPAR